jgi:hypothetical protein
VDPTGFQSDISGAMREAYREGFQKLDRDLRETIAITLQKK